MKILIISAEVAPIAKVGGLADVAGSLPKALHALGHDVRVLMPGYGYSLAAAPSPKLKSEFRVKVNPEWSVDTLLHESALPNTNIPLYMLSSVDYFAQAACSEDIYQPGIDQYLFFSQAALVALEELDWHPDVIHCNDWQTGLIPLLSKIPSVFTIHNLAYQGEWDPAILERVGLCPSLFNMHQTEAYGSVNFLKTGAVFASKTNTVSPTYASEIQTEEYGCRLEGLMTHLAESGRLSGILNGIDFDHWNPETDPNIHANFTVESMGGKKLCKSSLQKELKLPVSNAPLMSSVTRLSSQKGMDLILAGADAILASGAQLVIQGLGEPWLVIELRKLEIRYPKQMRLVERFDAQLAQKIYAASDLFLMPSAFEPCGLGQIIALRYGTIPVVRSTGGLADTIRDGENGFVFSGKCVNEFTSAVERALKAMASRKWAPMIRRAMRQDFGWSNSAAKYVDLYANAIYAKQNCRA